jgi:hypothetical protein
MPELISSGWLVLIATGGYALSLVQFLQGLPQRSKTVWANPATGRSNQINADRHRGRARSCIDSGGPGLLFRSAARRSSHQFSDISGQSAERSARSFATGTQGKAGRAEPTARRTYARAVPQDLHTGRFTRIAGLSTGIEEPEYAPGRYFTFQELSRDHDYVYLVDESRRKAGQPLLIRLAHSGRDG